MPVSSRTAARHRRPVRTRTPLAVIGEAVSSSGSAPVRRSAVIAASGGLIVTMGLPAVASPMLGADTAATSTTSTQVVQPSGQPASTVVSASAKAQVSFALTSVTTVDAAQYEHDEQVAAGERAAMQDRASRASTRFATTLAATTLAATKAEGVGDSGDDSATSAVASVSASASSVIDIAKRYTGIKYRFGGTTPAGFDCSGFVRYVYGQIGVDLPRTASQQASSGSRISASEAQAGDIVSFTGKGGVYHNGIYLGDGKMIDSPRTGKAIDVRDVWSSSVVFTRVA